MPSRMETLLPLAFLTLTVPLALWSRISAAVAVSANMAAESRPNTSAKARTKPSSILSVPRFRAAYPSVFFKV